MRQTLIATLALAAPALAQHHGEKQHDPAHLEKLFRSNCASCHLPPSTTFEVDRAWITQLADTA